ncbi:MAG TPA: efflux RND transporter periplasmic adaptor subunit [Opitutaceae bacterium]|nr:efflux RND transporter periplasmic adaptor subunit [Opitutaceae bacterium]
MTSPKPSLDDLRIERGPPRNAPPRLLLVAVAAVIALVMAGAVWWGTRTAAISVRMAVAREAPRVGNMRTVLNASGYVTARREATVSSKVTGKVIEVLVEEGMHVKDGQILARLDDTNIRASLQLAEAQLAAAKTALEETRVRLREAEQELQRQTSLREGKVATQADFDHAQAAALAFRARLEQQQADVAVAERTVAVWQQQLDDTVIRAPFTGIATSKNAQPGEMISPISAGGGFTRTGICTVVDMSSLEIEIDVNESYINRVEAGQPVEATLDAYPDWRIPCKVIAIIPTADREKSTVRVRVGFDQLDPRILPEMSVKVAFREAGGTAPAAATVLVPKAAIRQDAGRDVVMVVQRGRAERRAVTVLSAGANDTELSAGVAPGESVIVDAPKELTDGAAVKEINP